MKLSALKGKVQKTWIEIPGEDGEPPDKVEVHYRPGALTLEVSDQLQELARTNMEINVILVLLEPILVWWDLEDEVLDEEGNPTGETINLPVTPEGIKKVPLSFLGMIMDTINEESRPSPLTEETSEDSSAPEVSLADAQNGTQSSESPGTLVSLPGSSSTEE
jgi:hypothetical protein